MRRSTSRTASVYSSTLAWSCGPSSFLRLGQLLRHRVENALVLPQPRFARAPIRAAAVAEQPLEHRPRIPLHRQRLRRAAPRQRVRVDAAQVAGARAGVGRGVHRQLERRDLRLAGEMPREQLVHRHVGDDLDLVASAARGAGEKRSGGAGVDVVPVRLDARQHEHLIPERRQRLQNRRELERAALALRRPVLHRHPVRHIESLEPMRRLARRRSPRSENAGTIASRNGSAMVAPSPRRTVRRGNDRYQDIHGSFLHKQTARTLDDPRYQIADQRYCCAAASRTISVARPADRSTPSGRPERIGQQLFGDRARKLLGLVEQEARASPASPRSSRRSPWCRSRRRACPIRRPFAIRRSRRSSRARSPSGSIAE